MFHYRNNLYFARQPDGSVVITKMERSGDVDLTIFSATIDANGWASIVASVSKGGEENGRVYQAQRFHESEGEVTLLVNV